MVGVLDFGRQSARNQNVWANEGLDDRYKLQYVVSGGAIDQV